MWIAVLIFACAVIVIGAASVGYAKNNNHGFFGFSFGGGSAALQNTREFEAEGIENLEITYSSQNITFYQGEEDKIVIKEYLRESSKRVETKMQREGDTLYIKRDSLQNGFIFSFGFGCESIEVYLPKSFDGSVSGIVSSGNIETKEEWNWKAFYAIASSGNITCRNIHAEEMNVMASSGNIELGGAEGNAYLQTSSGNISAEFARVCGTISAAASSGNVKLELPKDSTFTFEGSASSGNINTDFDEMLSYNKKGNQACGTYGDNPEKACVKTSTSSGNSRVNLY